jgi:hypothetical protein
MGMSGWKWIRTPLEAALAEFLNEEMAPARSKLNLFLPGGMAPTIISKPTPKSANAYKRICSGKSAALLHHYCQSAARKITPAVLTFNLFDESPLEALMVWVAPTVWRVLTT